MISISGIFAVTFSVALAYVADITSEENRSWGYGLVSHKVFIWDDFILVDNFALPSRDRFFNLLHDFSIHFRSNLISLIQCVMLSCPVSVNACDNEKVC